MSSNKYPLALLVLILVLLTWSGIGVHDTRLTWVLETLPVMIALPVLALTFKRFRLTNLTYTLIALHAMILMLGGHYSYAKVPLGFWMEDWFGWTRNNYDKIGHVMQGFGPAIYVREIIARTSPLKPGKWLGLMSIAVPLAFSALYEIIEWLASLSDPTDTEAFLGTQGYIWDTQTDMFWCLTGSTFALILLTRLHNKYLSRIDLE
ncbi:MAG: Inner membrane protein YjdF [Syntrophorhabdaceae bacterium PtaU1.Bin034]|jgi:putative membrane protein|nr:MAG: Inner membrane protein YjdF [Syntrophorhabdaceae bacterium PtaU1.Bin034]